MAEGEKKKSDGGKKPDGGKRSDGKKKGKGLEDYPIIEALLVVYLLFALLGGAGDYIINSNGGSGGFLSAFFGGGASGGSDGSFFSQLFGESSGSGEGVGGGAGRQSAPVRFIKAFVLSMKIVGGVVSVGALAGLIYIVIQTSKIVAPHRRRVIAHDKDPLVVAPFFKEEWVVLRKKLEEASDSDAPYIIIEADAIVDKVLKSMGFRGETMGERLQHLGETNFLHIQHLWDAHKIRNKIAHEGAKSAHYSDAVFAIEQYERALRELGVI